MKTSYDRVYGKIKLTVISDRGNLRYTYKGKLHRNDGKPAIVLKTTSGLYKAWYKNGQRHREDGPAITGGERQDYYLHDCELTKDKWEEYLNLPTLKC